ncbi:MAG: hypothetical protein EOM62_15620 [Bacteroidia bacterium]|nr:hypothetical protein [Bacteroidia bacterium]
MRKILIDFLIWLHNLESFDMKDYESKVDEYISFIKAGKDKCKNNDNNFCENHLMQGKGCHGCEYFESSQIFNN